MTLSNILWYLNFVCCSCEGCTEFGILENGEIKCSRVLNIQFVCGEFLPNTVFSDGEIDINIIFVYAMRTVSKSSSTSKILFTDGLTFIPS